MPLVSTEAVILQTRKFSETSKIVSAFSQDKGRISVLIKGGRKGSRKFPGGMETLNRVELQYYYKSGRELQNFKSADLIASYLELRKDLQRTYSALSLAETVQRCTFPEDANTNLFQVLIEALAALDQIETAPWTIRWNSLLRLCRALGFGMNLQDCRTCGSKGPMRGFDLESGSFICGKCKVGKQQLLHLSGEIWGALRFLDTCPLEVSPRLSVNPTVGKRIEILFLLYFKYQVPGLQVLESWKMLPSIYWGTNAEEE
jgi:DNA repair protein RecO (recombination protein O)